LTQPIAWRPLMVSKVNTALLLVLVTAVLAKLAFHLDDHGIIIGLIYLTGATTIASGAAYLVRWGRGVAAPEPES
jgi:cardiolipin synthase